ncbi:putative GTPase [bacterium HR40]|nr:putative GTPase [bacterium HR40]
MPARSRLDELRQAGKPAFARALAEIEAAPWAPATVALLDAAHAASYGRVLGVTGPPGAGKSTLISAIVQGFRADGLRVAVIAVDPSSPKSGGALLGDRARFAFDPEDDGIFVRSMAARDRLGGVAELTWPAVALARALYDRVVVETVGVGQSETEIRDLADRVLLLVQPASGDMLQFMKAGILEIPDLVVVGKADLGPPAERAFRELQAALAHSAGSAPPVHLVSALEGQGMAELFALVRRLLASADGPPEHPPRWLEHWVRERYGRIGCACFRTFRQRFPDDGPFTLLARFARCFEAVLPPR